MSSHDNWLLEQDDKNQGTTNISRPNKITFDVYVFEGEGSGSQCHEMQGKKRNMRKKRVLPTSGVTG